MEMKATLQKTIKVKDKEFRLLLSSNEISVAITSIAQKMNLDLKGKNPLFIAVLNGSFLFAADLMRQISVESEISFVKMSSYKGTVSSQNVKEIIGLNEDVSGRTVVLIDDIVDTGKTLEKIHAEVNARNPLELKVATLLFKPDSYKGNIPIDYIGFEVPNDFVVGYGLDYMGAGRNLQEIYSIV